MICDRCGEPIPAGEEMEHFGQTLCEECTLSGLEREIATLRHMEKVRGELRKGKKMVRLW